MDWNLILKLGGPILISFLESTVKDLGTPTQPISTEVIKRPSEAIKHLQSFLNVALQINPPLDADGWLGPKTEAAIEAGIAKLRGAGIG